SAPSRRRAKRLTEPSGNRFIACTPVRQPTNRGQASDGTLKRYLGPRIESGKKKIAPRADALCCPRTMSDALHYPRQGRARAMQTRRSPSSGGLAMKEKGQGQTFLVTFGEPWAESWRAVRHLRRHHWLQRPARHECDHLLLEPVAARDRLLDGLDQLF